MSEKIKIEYRGYTIRFGDNSNTWYCHDFSLDDVDLGKIKSAIDKHLLKLRKASSVDAMMLHGGFDEEKVGVIPVKIVEYMNAIKSKTGQFGLGPKEVTDHRVAVMGTFSGNDKPSRREERLSNMIRAGTLTDALISEMAAEALTIKRAKARLAELRERLPRLTLEDVTELARIAEGTGKD